MKVLVIGSGGREHALVWKLAQSPLLEEMYCWPGNAGTASLARRPEVEPDDWRQLVNWALDRKIDLTVIGPEAPLVAGLADQLRQAGLAVFGPGREGARLEGSKIWAKEVMVRCGVPTAAHKVFASFDAARRYLEQREEGPVVVKADGLAAGKGVIVAADREEAAAALRRIMVEKAFGPAGSKVIMEEKLEGEEVSVLAITDGRRLLTLPAAQDHKAVGEGDRGPNTGGMGAYSPTPFFSTDLARRAMEQVFRPLLAELQRRGVGYRGVLYAGLMVKDGAFNVLEFNVRFGDPETQVILPRLDMDLLPILSDAAAGNLGEVQAKVKNDAAACVVLASAGYPGEYETGKPIGGLEEAGAEEGVAVFHAGTAKMEEATVTAGGRVLAVTALAPQLTAAVQKVYRAVEKIRFEGCYYRRDIAYRALSSSGGH